MERYLRAYLDKSMKPNRAQHLVVSDSKHLFFYEKDEELRHQQKELDPRTCGSRQMVTRLIAVDEDTGVLYGELWPRDGHLDLVGFLARAWARKQKHPMRGFPSVLHAPSRVLDDKRLSNELAWCASIGGVEVNQAPSGFGPTAVAAREYEKTVRDGGGGGRMVLRAAHMAAQEISYVACGNAASFFAKHWADVPGLPAAALAKFDAAYDESGSWRMGHFARFLVADGT